MFTPPTAVRLLLECAGLAPGFGGRILDPACGTGSILLGAGTRLGPHGTMVGIEQDPRLGRMARDNLRPWGERTTIRLGDALSMLDEVECRFDRVVANPPYVAWHRIDPAVRTRLEQGVYAGCPLRGRPRHSDQQPDLSLFFLVLGVHALKPGGRLAYLLPPEWLAAPRAAPLRKWLLDTVTLRYLIRFPAQVALFESRGGRSVFTGAMILAADRKTPPEGHHVHVLDITCPPADLGHTLVETSEWIARSGHPGALPRAARSTRIPQDRWGARPWQIQIPAPPLAHTVPLENAPGVRVIGGHQPRVAWLGWLTLEEADWEALPVEERRWLYPAILNASEIGFPLVRPSGRWWVFLPPELTDEAEVQALAPTLHRIMRARVDLARGSRARPARWWAFPNPRNLGLVQQAGPRLVVPRTCRTLRVSFDPVGHMIKGTNTLIMVDPGSPVSIHAWMGILNAPRLRAWADRECPDYHGVARRLEPAIVRRLPVPRIEDPRRQRLVRELDQQVREALAGAGNWEVVDTLANSIYE